LYSPRSPLRRRFFFLEQETLQHALPTYLQTYSPNHQNTISEKTKQINCFIDFLKRRWKSVKEGKVKAL
jgi:hypothetical protein